MSVIFTYRQLIEVAQNKKMRLTRLILSTIGIIRTNASADKFFEDVKIKVSKHKNLGDPELSRKQQKSNYSILQCVEGDTSKDAHYPETPVDHYRQVYFEAIDVFFFSLKYRF